MRIVKPENSLARVIMQGRRIADAVRTPRGDLTTTDFKTHSVALVEHHKLPITIEEQFKRVVWQYWSRLFSC
jgi:hypothetical protein